MEQAEGSFLPSCPCQGNFWQITGQEAFQWDDEIRANHGDSWCNFGCSCFPVLDIDVAVFTVPMRKLVHSLAS